MLSSGNLLSAFRKAVFVLVLVGLAGGASWGLWNWRGATGPHERYRTEEITRGRLVSLINASGTVVPEEVVDVGAQVAGKILGFGKDLDNSNRTIDYRSRVEENTLLAKIDDSLYKAEVGIAQAEYDVAQAEVKRCEAALEVCRARLTQATRDLDRSRRLGSSGAAAEYDNYLQMFQTSRAAIPAAEADLVKASKTVERARKVLERAATNDRYTEIRSPVAGVIIDRRVNIGQTVVASLNAPSLFLIAKDLRRMQVWASVNEADIGRIHVGQPVRFKVDAFPDEVFNGTVAQIRLNATMTQNVVTYTVVVSTDNRDLKLLPYLTANLQFRAAERDEVLRVANSALRYRPAPERVAPEHLAEYMESRKRRPTVTELKSGKQDDNQGILWVENLAGFLRPIRVRTGLTDGNTTEVVEVLEDELDEGDRVVVGEVQEEASAGSNPFAVKMWGKKKS